MNFLKKTLNKGISKSLIIYNNNTRLIRNKTRGWEKKISAEAKEFIYEFLIFLETRRGWYFKWAFISFIGSFAYKPLCFILQRYKTEMLYPTKVLQELEYYQKDSLQMNPIDNFNKNKILYSYWMNYL